MKKCMFSNEKTHQISEQKKYFKHYFRLIVIFLIFIPITMAAGTSIVKNSSNEIYFDIISFITAIGIIQGIFLTILLFRIRSGNHRANKILASFLLLLSIIILYNIYFFTGFFHKYPALYFIGEFDFLFYLLGPLIYFYVVCLTIPSFRFKVKHLLHMLPAVVTGLYVFLINRTKSIAEIMLYWDAYITNHEYHFSKFDTFSIIGIIIHIGIYYILALRLLSVHKKNIKNYFSSIEHINLSWLYYIVRFSLYIYILIEMVQIYWIFGGDYGWIITQRIFPILVTMLIFAIGYKGIMQHEIFLTIPDENSNFADSKISNQLLKIDEITEKLLKVMEEKKPYLDSQLTLPMLADLLDVSRNNLSHAINVGRNQNFFDFINTYRINTAKEYLDDPAKKDLNVLEIAFLSGFNSKTTFNSSFKKVTGFTPTEYRKLSANPEKP